MLVAGCVRGVVVILEAVEEVAGIKFYRDTETQELISRGSIVPISYSQAVALSKVLKFVGPAQLGRGSRKEFGDEGEGESE